MANTVCDVLLTEAPLAAPAADNLSETGALVEFRGIVRASEDGAEIAAIEYEAHPTMAEHQLRQIAMEAGAQFDLQHILLQHRLGRVGVGEASLFLRVGSRHRAAAFSASVWIVDELKRRVPIWKHPVSVKTARAEPPSLPV